MSGAWRGRALRRKCECEACARCDGPSSHDDETHDQRLTQAFPLRSVRATIHLHGGTTKCARVLMDWFDKGDGRRVVDFVNRDVVEVGCGTGLVGLALALLGARSVVLTDQEPVMDIVQSSIDGNVVDGTATWVSAHPLYWGDDVPDALRGKDIIVGADLIFAHENIPLLLRTFSALCTDRSQTIVFAHINRFAWEPGFFTGMASAGFRQETVLVDGDVTIFRFTRCGGAPLLS